uniref:Uncharacterized protein n=1 Tax=Anopheles funestus TaxID=62324 RepID=A0A182S3J2_ANOFN
MVRFLIENNIIQIVSKSVQYNY